MRLANEAAAIAFRVLNKCTDELSPAGAWRWRCAVQNGTRLPIAASLEEGFLHLACNPDTSRNTTCTLEHALLGNNSLPGGVKLAMNSANSSLQLSTDIAILEEKHLFDRFHWALDGFHHGLQLLKSPVFHSHCEVTAATTCEPALGILLRETSWPSTERGLNDFSVQLDARSAPAASVRMSECGLLLNSELVRANTNAETSRQALAVFLLTATSALRLVRAYSEQLDCELAYGVQVNLPCAPATEEIDHGLAALSIAHRMCSQETNVLLNEATARYYLAARDLSTTNDHQSEQEN